MDGWKRNGTGLKQEDIALLFQIKDAYFFAPVDSDGLFECTLSEFARTNRLLIPSLGDIVDYVNIDLTKNGRVINDYLKKNVLITSSGIEVSESGRVTAVQLDDSIRRQSGFQRSSTRGMYFAKFNQWIDVADKASLIYAEHNILETIFDRKYDDIMSAMNGVAKNVNKKILIPDYARENSALSVLLHKDELIIYKHNICGGEFCFL